MGEWVGGVLDIHAWPSSYDQILSHPCSAGTAHVGFLPTRPTSLAPSAKRRVVLNCGGRGEQGRRPREGLGRCRRFAFAANHNRSLLIPNSDWVLLREMTLPGGQALASDNNAWCRKYGDARAGGLGALLTLSFFRFSDFFYFRDFCIFGSLLSLFFRLSYFIHSPTTVVRLPGFAFVRFCMVFSPCVMFALPIFLFFDYPILLPFDFLPLSHRVWPTACARCRPCGGCDFPRWSAGVPCYRRRSPWRHTSTPLAPCRSQSSPPPRSRSLGSSGWTGP